MMEAQLNNLRVLVVESEIDSAELCKLILELAGAQVMAVTSAGAAIAVQEWFQADIFIINPHLPDFEGYLLTDVLRSSTSQRRLRPIAVAIAPSVREVNYHKIRTAGFQTHICKPITPDAIVTKLASLVQLEQAS